MNKVFIVVQMALLTLIAYQGVSLVYQGLLFVPLLNEQKGGGTENSGRLEKIGKTISKGPQNQYQEIVRRNVFKVLAQTKTKPPSQPINSSGKTSLKIDLWGTVVGDSDKLSYAVIKDKKTRDQSLFQVGDVIQGATLQQIMRNKIVLNIDGRDLVVAVNPNTTPVMSGSGFSPALKPGTFLPGVAPPGITPNINSGALLTQVKMRPYFKNGQPLGLLVYGIKPGSEFQKIGLANGDVVKSVNGAPTRSTQDGRTIYQNLKTASDQRVLILRQGLEKMLVYNAGSNSYTVEAMTK